MASSEACRLIDFHSHFFERDWMPAPPQVPGSLPRAWPVLTDLDAQLAATAEGGVDAHVLTAPVGNLVRAGESLPLEMMKRINERFASLVAAHPGRLLALATIDAFQGEVAAREVERAVDELRLGGICVDCASGDRFLDAPEARPTLEAAAALGVPVFIHPVNPAGLTARLAPLGRSGVLLARGTEETVSVIALMRSGVLDALPRLIVVLPMLGVAALLFASPSYPGHEAEEGWTGSHPTELRRRLYIDTLGWDPAAIRFVVGLLGADHVLAGSDFPIRPIMPRAGVERILAEAGVEAADRARIMSGNAERLLARPNRAPA